MRLAELALGLQYIALKMYVGHWPQLMRLVDGGFEGEGRGMGKVEV